MQAYPPYSITHIRLNEQLAMPPLHFKGQGNYFVFWWREMALGHLFLKPGKPLSVDDFHQKTLQAIAPSLRFYTLKTPEMTSQLLQLFQQGAFALWADAMASIFSVWHPDEIPATVPVSVVICTRDRAADLHSCLTRLSALQCQPQEIVVVDNAPTDDASFRVVEQFAGVRYVKEPRGGLDIARNTGVTSAVCEVVAFCDDDVVVHPLWVYQVWQTFQDSAVAAMTGLVLAAELQTEAQLIFEKHWSFNRGYTDRTYDSAYFKATLAKGPPVWEIGAGANMAFRKSVLNAVGYFDELLDVGAAGCSGDSEMWYRILLHGHAIRYNPKAIVFHRHRQEMKALHRQLFSYMRGFTAAALTQQQHYQAANYRSRLLKSIPKYYFRLLCEGFPRYNFRFRTVGSEMHGIVSGLLYYQRNRGKVPYPKSGVQV